MGALLGFLGRVEAHTPLICNQGVSPICWSFFFSSRRRHTRCLSDWSSDVCSSDLTNLELQNAYPGSHATSNSAFLSAAKAKLTESTDYYLGTTVDQIAAQHIGQETQLRSEERRVGKECRYRGSPDH